MMLKNLPMDLKLFDGAAGAGDGAGAAEGETGGQSGNQGEGLTPPTRPRKGKSGDVQNVVYGKQPTAVAGDEGQGDDSGPSDAGKGKETDVQVTSDALEDKRKAYREMVNGEFREQYEQDIQFILDRRFKDHKALEKQASDTGPILELLMQRYDIRDGDLAKLTAALQEDDAWMEKAAAEAGMTKDQFEAYDKMRRENEALRAAERRRVGQEAADRQMQIWYEQAEEAKKVYPSLDLKQESKDPQFVAMLKSGVSVEHAYKVIHMDEIEADIAAMQAKATEKKVTDGIRAKGLRPTENGTNSQSGFTTKSDVSKLTKADRAEIARRVQMGAHIEF